MYNRIILVDIYSSQQKPKNSRGRALESSGVFICQVAVIDAVTTLALADQKKNRRE